MPALAEVTDRNTPNALLNRYSDNVIPGRYCTPLERYQKTQEFIEKTLAEQGHDTAPYYANGFLFVSPREEPPSNETQQLWRDHETLSGLIKGETRDLQSAQKVVTASDLKSLLMSEGGVLDASRDMGDRYPEYYAGRIATWSGENTRVEFGDNRSFIVHTGDPVILYRGLHPPRSREPGDENLDGPYAQLGVYNKTIFGPYDLPIAPDNIPSVGGTHGQSGAGNFATLRLQPSVH